MKMKTQRAIATQRARTPQRRRRDGHELLLSDPPVEHAPDSVFDRISGPYNLRCDDET